MSGRFELLTNGEDTRAATQAVGSDYAGPGDEQGVVGSERTRHRAERDHLIDAQTTTARPRPHGEFLSRVRFTGIQRPDRPSGTVHPRYWWWWHGFLGRHHTNSISSEVVVACRGCVIGRRGRGGDGARASGESGPARTRPLDYATEEVAAGYGVPGPTSRWGGGVPLVAHRTEA